MPITITGVPPTTRKPGAYIEINTKGARAGLPVVADRVLFLGHKRPTGSGVPNQAVQVYSVDEARTVAGLGTPLALMVEAALEQNPLIAELWVLPVTEDGAGVVATGSLAFTVSSLVAGTLYVYIGRHMITLGVTSTMTNSAIASALATAINNQSWLPFSASASVGTVTLTCRTKGLAGNSWRLRVVYSATGLSTVVTQPTSGATDGSVTSALDAIAGTQFDLIVSEFNSSTVLDALHTHLSTLAGPMEQRPGLAMAGLTGTVGDATTLATGRNSPYLLLPLARTSRTHPCELAAALAAAFTAEPDRARPLNNVVLKPVVPPDDVVNILTRTEQESLLANGVTPIVPRGSNMTIVRSITTYVRNAAGDLDDTLLDAQTLRVLFYFQYALGRKFRDELGQVKVAAVARGPNTTDPDKIKSLAVGVAMEMQDQLGYLQGVEDDLDRFVFELDALVPGRVNGQVPARIVPGLHVLAASIDLILA